MGLADYLAKNYLSADKPSKKRKRKAGTSSGGLIIADDDDDTTTRRRKNAASDDDEFSPVVVGDARAGGGGGGGSDRTKKTTTTTWKSVGTAAPTNAEQAAADAILSAAAAERSRRDKEEDEEAPAVVDGEGAGGYDGPTMASGAMAGLQTAAQVTAALERKERAEKRAMMDMGLDGDGKAQETVYRDASGRRIDVAMKRAEMRRKAVEEERKRAEDRDAAVGDVQRREREGRRRELEDARLMGVARYADDEELNREMKDKGRWNDPMAQMVSDAGTGTKVKKGRRKVYEGASEPNRYGIKPGYRWDGVDRANGFERKWFAARNTKQSKKDLEYAWEMDE